MTNQNNGTGLLIAAVICFLMFGSHVGWYVFAGVSETFQDCRARGISPVYCEGRSGFGLLGVILSIPANIFHAITKFFFGADTFGFNMALFGVTGIGLLVYRYRKPLFEATTEAASYTVRHDTPKPDLNAAKRAAETVRQDKEHVDAQTELEEAIRDMEAAKARVAELDKNRR